MLLMPSRAVGGWLERQSSFAAGGRPDSRHNQWSTELNEYDLRHCKVSTSNCLSLATNFRDSYLHLIYCYMCRVNLNGVKKGQDKLFSNSSKIYAGGFFLLHIPWRSADIYYHSTKLSIPFHQNKSIKSKWRQKMKRTMKMLSVEIVCRPPKHESRQTTLIHITVLFKLLV